MSQYVQGFRQIDRTQVALVGGKGANLGELSRIDGVIVPPGFCITTHAFQQFMAEVPTFADHLAHLSRLHPDDLAAIRTQSSELRRMLEHIAIPDTVTMAILGALSVFPEETAWAVRSSATAEDSASASFAGQQDTYLNIVGPVAVLDHVRRCWASLFTERAVSYRVRSGMDHRSIRMGVVVQQMVVPEASGILFTADPVSGNRNIVSIEATFGLGEALVSGLVNADVFRVRDDGTVCQEIAPEPQQEPALTGEQVLRLARLGRQIEAHFGRPQDIEWCLADDTFLFVQSRPITTLFPIPARDDADNHVYVSVGHQQMMTDAMKPLGISFWQMTTPRPMDVAGSRLFVDVAGILASAARREDFLEMLGKSDPLIGDALRSLLDRGDFIAEIPDTVTDVPPPVTPFTGIASDPAIVTGLIERNQASVATLKRDIQGKSGTALLEFILADMQELRRILFDPQGHQAIMAGMEATWWLNEKLQAWLGEINASDTLTQSVPNNITSEMGLALLDVADAIRPYSAVIDALQRADNREFLDTLPALEGGVEAQAIIREWLEIYGMRGPGEIDITRPRWSEHPEMLAEVILGHIRNFPPGEASRRFEQGRQEASDTERDLLARLRNLPDGEQKADEAKRMIDRVRIFAGYREYPKYGMINRYFIYKQALLAEADRLVQAGIFRDREDMFFLTFQELQDVVRTGQVDRRLIRERRDAFRADHLLTPPRVFTSDGEIIRGSYRREGVPDGALSGLPVSAGVVEGRARVILNMADAVLDAGDILVTVFTDPGWTPLFAGISGLVTEVGGLMTHGAVIAREYGLPAVVGVEQATRLIRDGQRIRLDGTNGYIEMLPES